MVEVDRKALVPSTGKGRMKPKWLIAQMTQWGGAHFASPAIT